MRSSKKSRKQQPKNTARWTAEDEELLIDLVKKTGGIAWWFTKYFPNRTEGFLKHKLHEHIRKEGEELKKQLQMKKARQEKEEQDLIEAGEKLLDDPEFTEFFGPISNE